MRKSVKLEDCMQTRFLGEYFPVQKDVPLYIEDYAKWHLLHSKYRKTTETQSTQKINELMPEKSTVGQLFITNTLILSLSEDLP